MKDEQKQAKGMRLTLSMVRVISDMAEDQNRTFSNMVEVLLTKALKEAHEEQGAA